LTTWLLATGTSMTRPLTCATIGTTYLTTLTSVLVGATTLSVSSVAIITTMGKITTPTFHGVVQGSHLNLMKTSQTMEA
jgi:hypothetical protein